MHNERCTSGSEGGPKKPGGRKADRALRPDPTVRRVAGYCQCCAHGAVSILPWWIAADGRPPPGIPAAAPLTARHLLSTAKGAAVEPGGGPAARQAGGRTYGCLCRRRQSTRKQLSGPTREWPGKHVRQPAPCLGPAGTGKRKCGGRREDARCDGAADGHGSRDGGSVSPAKSARRLSATRAADAFTESRARCA